jgi:hypothetical protein
MNPDEPLPPQITEAMLDAYRYPALFSPFGDGEVECPICGALLEPGERAQGLTSVADGDVPSGCWRCSEHPTPSPPHPPRPPKTARDRAGQPEGSEKR